jgi:threonine dehydratase
MDEERSGPAERLFKIRGPNAFLTRNPVPNKVVTSASTGNHAIGLSMAATTRGLSAEIMVPQTTPKTKLDAIQRAGGTINLIDGDYEEALARAETFAKDTGAVLVPSYDHVDTIYGNQQVFEEIKEDLGRSNHPVFAPIGGGGILSGAIQAHADWSCRGLVPVSFEQCLL